MMNNLQLSLIKTYLQDSDKNIIEHIYKLNNIDPLINIKIFSTNNNILLNNKNYPILPIYESKYVYDIIFVWDLLTLEQVMNFPNQQKIIYYQSDSVPWLNHGYIPYRNWETFFNNNNISVITDQEENYKIISCIWEKCIYIPNFNIKDFYGILKTE